MTANLKAAAQAIRRAGAKAAPGDTELIHATPKEVALLKAKGGSGKVDPRTGLRHFSSFGGGENTSGGPTGEGGAGNGRGNGGGESRDNNDDKEKERAAMAQAARDAAMNRLGVESGAISTEGTNDTVNADGTRNVGGLQSSMAYMTRTKHTFTDYLKALFGGAAGLSTAGPIGAAAGFAKGLGAGTQVSGWEHVQNSNVPGVNESGRGNDNLTHVQAAVKKATEAPAAVTPAVTPFDYFTSNTRGKQGYQSTILGGGLPVNPVPPKKLMGV